MTDDDILDGLFAREGGLSDHPADPGRLTKYGITLPTLTKWRYPRPTTSQDVRDLTVGEARDIYRAYYLAPFASVEPPELRAQVVDIAVNSGQHTAEVLLARARHRAQATPPTPEEIALRLVGERLRFYARLIRNRPDLATFLPGWINRALHFAPALQ